AWYLGLQVGDLVGGVGHSLFRATGLLYLLFASAALHFALVFPRPLPLIVGRPGIVRAIYAAPYVLVALYLVASRPGAPSVLAWLGEWNAGVFLPYAFAMALIVVVMVAGYRRQRDAAIRQ